jgi:hypothetical protein
LAFDEDGRPVLVTEPAVYDDDDDAHEPPARDYGAIFSMLIMGATDAETYRRRVLGWGYLLKANGAPQSLAELGTALGISKQAAAKWLTAFRATLREIAQENGFDG